MRLIPLTIEPLSRPESITQRLQPVRERQDGTVKSSKEESECGSDDGGVFLRSEDGCDHTDEVDIQVEQEAHSQVTPEVEREVTEEMLHDGEESRDEEDAIERSSKNTKEVSNDGQASRSFSFEENLFDSTKNTSCSDGTSKTNREQCVLNELNNENFMEERTDATVFPLVDILFGRIETLSEEETSNEKNKSFDDEPSKSFFFFL